MHQHGIIHFIQDGAPCHKAMIVTKRFSNRSNVKLIKWLSHFPDFNPVEKVWSRRRYS
jgi:hypothetical protein